MLSQTRFHLPPILVTNMPCKTHRQSRDAAGSVAVNPEIQRRNVRRQIRRQFMDLADDNVRTGVARDVVFWKRSNQSRRRSRPAKPSPARGKSRVEGEFHPGQRVTDEATVKIVDDVLSREINPEIVKTINALAARPQLCRAGHFQVPQALARRPGKPGPEN